MSPLTHGNYRSACDVEFIGVCHLCVKFLRSILWLINTEFNNLM